MAVPTDWTTADAGPPAGVVRGRFAPSPTGRLHLGNARTALLSWLDTRARGGTYVLRIENVDPQRSQPAHEHAQLADLRWLGLDWDEGPDVGGAYGPYRQSECGPRYLEALARLTTFACTCTRRELRAATLAPHGAEPVYPGTCRAGPRDPSRSAARRWAVPPGTVTVTDRICGTVTEDVAAQVGEFVLRRADGAWAYQLAVVVDDAAMAITDVVRGVDLWPSTARQVWLQRALSLPTPRYAHVPLVRTEAGTKLGKRAGAATLSALRESGIDPARVVAALAHSAGLVEASVRSVMPQQLLADFSLTRVRVDGPAPRW